MSQSAPAASDPFVQQLLDEIEGEILRLPGVIRKVTPHGCICMSYDTPETEWVEKKRSFAQASDGFEKSVHAIRLMRHHHKSNVACLRKKILTLTTNTYAQVNGRAVETTSCLELTTTTTGLQLINSEQEVSRGEQPTQHDYGVATQDVISDKSLLTFNNLTTKGLGNVRDRVAVIIQEIVAD